jgi:GntR family transcriptional regulator, sialic acid-inducible nan operon repressor
VSKIDIAEGPARLTRAADAIAQGLRERTFERRRLSDQITAELEQLVVSGQLKAGETLPSERELMVLFGVGRTSIREALFALQRKGIVNAQAGLRPVVTAPRAEAIVAELSGTVRLFLASEPGTREFQAARRFFEPAVARFAAEHATPDDVERMAAAMAACAESVDAPEKFVEADVAFHFAIVQTTHNQLLIALHRAVLEWLREQRVSSIEPSGSSKAAHRAHRRVFEAIRERDADRAEQAMIDHLNEVERYYWKARSGSRVTKPGPSKTATQRRRVK